MIEREKDGFTSNQHNSNNNNNKNSYNRKFNFNIAERKTIEIVSIEDAKLKERYNNIQQMEKTVNRHTHTHTTIAKKQRK